jgi:hypothetical protein
MAFPTSQFDPVTLDDMELQRRNLEMLGLDEGLLGRLNAWRTDRLQNQLDRRDDFRDGPLRDGAQRGMKNADETL